MHIKSWNNPIHVGMTFIFKGDYCTVVKMKRDCFQYSVQGSNIASYMTYEYYTTTPSFAARQRNYSIK
jgi:hypothetical protein